MKKRRWLLAVFVFILLIAAACFKAAEQREQDVDQIYTVSRAGSGNVLLTWYENENMTIALVSADGRIQKAVTAPQRGKNVTYQIQAACAGEDGRVYVLRNSLDKLNGSLLTEDLMVYDFNERFPKATVISVENLQSTESEKLYDQDWHYGWMSISGDVLSVIGTNPGETTAVRRVFEFGDISERTVNIKSERFYPLAEDEGIYQAVGNGTDIVYISKAGKVFHADAEKVTEIYPARQVQTLMYPLYIAFAESGYVYIQDGESGNILKLNIHDGEETIVKKGTEGFYGSVRPSDITMMSMSSLSDFAAIAETEDGDGYQLFTMEDGIPVAAQKLVWSVKNMVWITCKYLLIELTAALLIVGLIWGIYHGIIHGRTIMGKLMLAALPLMILTMSIFGAVAYKYYYDSVVASYEKQAIDEGNMMTALFGQEAFDALEYPYDYITEDYRYLEEQIARRDLYARVVYFEDGKLYTGVDNWQPCFYPIGISVNTSLDKLYLNAAMTGEAVTSTLTDRMGERIVSVTPVGGTAGRSVYLYETGIFTARMDEYQSYYIRNFIWICAAFLLVLIVLLTAMFMKILQPLSEIRQGMELFAGGDRDIRIEPETKDELAKISRVFNKMADDIDLQIVNLKNMSDIYYRFMPMSMIRLLKQDNLGNLVPGSCIKGNYAVLSVQLQNNTKNQTLQDKASEMNRFFKMVSTEAKKQNVLPVADSANLSSMMLICQEGVVSAMQTALAVLAGLDAYNAGVDEDARLHMTFVLHRADISVVICGDDNQYIPAMITPCLDAVTKERDVFARMGARLLITEEAFREIPELEGLAIRYVGTLGIENSVTVFYECYEDKDAQAAHLVKITESNFRKAMKLYEEGYLYEAKNLFAMVLQDNPNDLIARYYIFRCG